MRSLLITTPVAAIALEACPDNRPIPSPRSVLARSAAPPPARLAACAAGCYNRARLGL